MSLWKVDPSFSPRVKARWDFVNRMAEMLGMGSDFELSTLEDGFNEMFKTFATIPGKAWRI